VLGTDGRYVSFVDAHYYQFAQPGDTLTPEPLAAAVCDVPDCLPRPGHSGG
jgi:hypothetical protein